MKDLPSKEHYCNKIHIISNAVLTPPPLPPSPPLFIDNRPYMDYLPQFC